MQNHKKNACRMKQFYNKINFISTLNLLKVFLILEDQLLPENLFPTFTNIIEILQVTINKG